ncbi:MAG: hypothetical protein IJN72_10920, partial [Firmicutes bacterium]|nr:hypothetical protein [Bacillota bacterium]
MKNVLIHQYKRKLFVLLLILALIFTGFMVPSPASADTGTAEITESTTRTFVYNDGTLLVNVPIENQIEMAELHSGVLYMYAEVTQEDEPAFGSGLMLSPMEGNMPAEEIQNSEENPDEILPGDGTAGEASDTSGEENSGEEEENNERDILGDTSGESSGTDSEAAGAAASGENQGGDSDNNQDDSSSEKTGTETGREESGQPDSGDTEQTPADNTGSDDTQSSESNSQDTSSTKAEELQTGETTGETEDIIIEADVPDEEITMPEEIETYSGDADAQAEDPLLIGEEQAAQNQTIAVVANISPAGNLDFSVSESIMMTSVGTTTALSISDLVITNNSDTVNLKVQSISVTGASGWSLVAADTDFESLDVDSRKMGLTIAGTHDFATGDYTGGSVPAGSDLNLSLSGNAAPVSQDMTSHMANMVVTVTEVAGIEFKLYVNSTLRETCQAEKGMTWAEFIDSDYAPETYFSYTYLDETGRVTYKGLGVRYDSESGTFVNPL